jgi:hypothetical protein
MLSNKSLIIATHPLINNKPIILFQLCPMFGVNNFCFDKLLLNHHPPHLNTASTCASFIPSVGKLTISPSMGLPSTISEAVFPLPARSTVM